MSEDEIDARNRRFNRNQNRQAQNPGQQQQQQNVAGASTQANQQYYSGGQQGIVFLTLKNVNSYINKLQIIFMYYIDGG